MWWCLTVAYAQEPAADPAPPPHEHGDHATMHHAFDDAEKWATVFDDPARDAWQKPAALVSGLELAPGDTVADIGAGTGYFEPWLAVAVGREGKVVAIDIEPSMVDHLKTRAAAEGTPTVEARLGTASDPGLHPKEADLVLLVDTYHHIDGRVDYFRRLRDAVAKRGELVIVDFRADLDTPVGPPREHRLPEDQVRSELAEAGWTYVRAIDGLPYQYALVFAR